LSAPIGPYSPIVRAGPWLVSSGQLGVEPNSDPSSAPALVVGGVVAQLTQALANGERLLESEGASRSDVIKTTVFITDMDDFATVNQAYSSFFGDHRPARSVIGVVALPLGALVEVELWAYQPS
jgi:2-iminobutanoate/2-iminopropanoate deaminase